MKKFKSAFSENAIIPWMITVAIMPMIFVSFFAYSIAKDILNQAINQYLESAIQKKIEIINTYITERKLDLIQVSRLPILTEYINQTDLNQPITLPLQNSMDLFTNYLTYFSPKIGLLNLYLINTSGKVIYALEKDILFDLTLNPTQTAHLDLYKAFDGARILRIPYLLNEYNYSTKENFQAAILISTVVIEKGIVKGVLVMKLDPDNIEQVINRQLGYSKSEETFMGTVLHNRPTVIMHAHQVEDEKESELNKQLLELLNRAIRGESGEPVEIIDNNTSILAVYRYVPQLNMGMVIQFAKDEVFQRIYWLKFNMFLLIGTSLFFVFLIVYWISRALWRANVKSEQLLENILPKFVIEELKEKKYFNARNLPSVSIVFIDIVNFTPFASSTNPQNVVRILDDIFSIFDQLCEKYQLEKIKTIGDAYMAVANLTSVQDDHANRAVDLGLDIISAVRHYNIDHRTNFAIRVGIDSGSITAGIIGKKKFSYDLWGSAVNLASRMESTGVENKIQITSETFALLQNKEKYIITERKNVTVKGIGQIDTFLIETH